jgi:hypothetical protein
VVPVEPQPAAAGTPAEPGLTVLAGAKRDSQAEARKALAARAQKLPGSPSRAAVIRDLSNPSMPPEQFADAMAWVVAQEAEVEALRRQGDALPGRKPEPESTPEQDEAEVEAAVERAKERRAMVARQAAEGSMRAQLEAAQQAGAAPPSEPVLDPGKRPRPGRKPGKPVTPETVSAALAVPPVGPSGSTARLEAMTGEGQGGDW